MKDWYESHKSFGEQTNHVAAAAKAWQAAHPGEVLDYDRAREEYEQAKKFESGHLLLGKQGNWTVDKVAEAVTLMMPCPKCGSLMEFETMITCSQVNPKHYTGLFDCSGDGCFYHFYTKTKLLDLRQIISHGKFDLIDKTDGVI